MRSYYVEHVSRLSGQLVQCATFEGKAAAVQWARARSWFNRDASCVLRRCCDGSWFTLRRLVRLRYT